LTYSSNFSFVSRAFSPNSLKSWFYAYDSSVALSLDQRCQPSRFRHLCPVLESSENWTLFKEFLWIWWSLI
jgi:hypothetical protein